MFLLDSLGMNGCVIRIAWHVAHGFNIFQMTHLMHEGNHFAKYLFLFELVTYSE